jgi:hypothetical protein
VGLYGAHTPAPATLSRLPFFEKFWAKSAPSARQKIPEIRISKKSLVKFRKERMVGRIEDRLLDF